MVRVCVVPVPVSGRVTPGKVPIGFCGDAEGECVETPLLDWVSCSGDVGGD